MGCCHSHDKHNANDNVQNNFDENITITRQQNVVSLSFTPNPITVPDTTTTTAAETQLTSDHQHSLTSMTSREERAGEHEFSTCSSIDGDDNNDDGGGGAVSCDEAAGLWGQHHAMILSSFSSSFSPRNGVSGSEQLSAGENFTIMNNNNNNAVRRQQQIDADFYAHVPTLDAIIRASASSSRNDNDDDDDDDDDHDGDDEAALLALMPTDFIWGHDATEQGLRGTVAMCEAIFIESVGSAVKRMRRKLDTYNEHVSLYLETMAVGGAGTASPVRAPHFVFEGVVCKSDNNAKYLLRSNTLSFVRRWIDRLEVSLLEEEEQEQDGEDGVMLGIREVVLSRQKQKQERHCATNNSIGLHNVTAHLKNNNEQKDNNNNNNNKFYDRNVNADVPSRENDDDTHVCI
eukprot:PhM_4_TR16165/c8_g1_i6/m.24613